MEDCRRREGCDGWLGGDRRADSAATGFQPSGGTLAPARFVGAVTASGVDRYASGCAAVTTSISSLRPTRKVIILHHVFAHAFGMDYTAGSRLLMYDRTFAVTIGYGWTYRNGILLLHKRT